jgi:hypothetical protein
MGGIQACGGSSQRRAAKLVDCIALAKALANGRVNRRADRMALPVEGSLARSPNTAYVRKRGSMKIILEVPRQAGVPAHLVGRHRLRFTTEHPSSSYGLGVLLDKDDEVLGGGQFTVLRNTLGARILTSDVRKVTSALGLPYPARGIELVLQKARNPWPRARK